MNEEVGNCGTDIGPIVYNEDTGARAIRHRVHVRVHGDSSRSHWQHFAYH
ncbi:hypothetical protein FTUN_8580 [Frigoriglobus tundricola]|uniref:Uncharacterized protein n=1 Tax=Frigoriglobus tundricola TaxID=2774151 RepID=A0A6M5Z5U3_9BACT|nr:hypothetical protein FTUN_8580 [Frigoriglobus tundricola]